MAVSEYFTDEELETQLRMHFDYDKMWTINFRNFFNNIIDNGSYLYLKIYDREFHIDPLTGVVTEVSGEVGSDE